MFEHFDTCMLPSFALRFASVERFRLLQLLLISVCNLPPES